jgi:hypothetical protein
MPHTVESTIVFNERDLARGAEDLYGEDTTIAPPLLSNSTIIQKAVSVVKEAAPSIIETIVSQFVPVTHHHSGNGPIGDLSGTDHVVGPDVMVSPPVVIVTVPVNDTIPVPPPPVDTVTFD